MCETIFSLVLLPFIMSQKIEWQDNILNIPYEESKAENVPILYLIRQDYEELEINKSVIKTPMRIGSQSFQRGLGTHSVSHIRLYSPDPIKHLSAQIGVDNNERTQGGIGSVTFSVTFNEKEIYRSKVFHGGQEPEKIKVDVNNANFLDLLVDDAGDGPACDHANWADAKIVTASGKTLYLDEMKRGIIPVVMSKYPFSFKYSDKSSDDILNTWHKESKTEKIDSDRQKTITTLLDQKTGLKLTFEATRFSDYPALEWILYFENTGNADTPIIQEVKSLDLTFGSPVSSKSPYILHKTNGSPSNPTDFEVESVVVDKKHPESMGGGGGRSSNKDFPFYKIETGAGSYIVAVGWSGQWSSEFECADNKHLHVTAGLEKTHFLLHPGEKIRSPLMLVMYWDGDTIESNAQFRQLIYKHYTATRNGKKIDPILFCNTCFTRGGGWLNECNAENQISLIKAYAPLGLEALITDAGWFEGGWPAGAGNWTPRKDAYP
ncbi:MAG: NPCBM/NEW2 domain-containing protein, partial [Candidatus Poribacteria bacterium]